MQTISRYQIKGELGRGGMATVYHAYDPRFKREVAVKVLPREFLHDTDFRSRFEREAQTIAALEHPAIVPVYDYGETDGILYLVMRYLPGGSLARRVARGPMPLPDAVRILQHLAPGLDYAHAQGMVHRDLKPGNILFDAWENPYLSDFGIVKLALGSETALTKTGGLVGTPAYMSPEQVRGLEELDGRSDIYAIGVLLYHMLSGKLPYEADTPIGQAFMHVNAPVPTIGDVRRDLPPTAAQVITRTLAKDREERYDTAGDLAEALAQAVPAAAAPAAPVPPPSKPRAAAPVAPSTPQPQPAEVHDRAEDPAPSESPSAAHPAVRPEKPQPQEQPQARTSRRVPLWGWAFLATLLLFLCAGSLLVISSLLPGADEIAGAGESTAAATPAPANTTAPVAGSDLTCDDALGCVSVAPGDPIRLASVLVASGPLVQVDIDTQWGIEIAIEQRGDVAGHAIELQAEDEECSQEGAQAFARKIVSDPTIVGILSTNCARFALSAARIIAENGYVMIAPAHASPEMTDPATRQDGYFRTSYSYVEQGRAMAHFAFNELGARSAAAIHEDDEFTTGIATAFRDAFAGLGGDVLAFEEVGAAIDVSLALDTFAAGAPPDFLYLATYSDLGATLTQQTRQIDGLSNTVLAGAEYSLDPDFLADAGNAALGMLFSNRITNFENAIYDNFLVAYEQVYGEMPNGPFHAHAYDATNIMLDAIEQVVQVGDDGALLIGRQALRDAVTATSNHMGITGTLTCDANGDCADPHISIHEVQQTDGALDFVPNRTYAP